VRAKLALSYLGLLLLAGVLLLSVVLLFLLRYVPQDAVRVSPDDLGYTPYGGPSGLFIPGRGDLWEAFWPKAAAAMLGLLALGLVGGWILAGRVLAPLTRLTAATRAAGAGDLSYRVHMPGRRDEFRDLSDSFDAMLARIEASSAEQRRFAANASHELRTPLAITQALLDVAQKDPDRDVDDLINRLTSVNARAVKLTEALLTLSRADQGAFARELVDLSLCAEQVAEALLPLAEQRGVTVEVTGEAAWTIGSSALLEQMMLNLAHNAIVHNVPDRGAVLITTAAGPYAATVTVQNTGALVPAEKLPTLTEPFQRGTDRAHSDHEGVGLGLAVVNSIVRAHGGTLRLAPRPGGGLIVIVQVPTHPRAQPDP